MDKNAVILQKGETVDYKWVDKKTIMEMEVDTLASSRSLKIFQERDI